MSEFDSKISAAEKRARELFELLETYRPKFFDAIITYTKPWIADRVQQGATIEYPLKTKEMSTSHIAEIKTEIKKAIDESASDNKLLLDNKKLWPHLGEMPKGHDRHSVKPDDYEIMRNFEESISQVVKLHFGKAGRILKKFGLIEFRQYGEWTAGEKDVFYGYGVTLPESIKSLIAGYNEHFRELFSKAIELNGLKLQKARQEAMDVWKKS